MIAPSPVTSAAASNRTRKPFGERRAVKAPPSSRPSRGRASQSGASRRRSPVATSATIPCPLASNRPPAAWTETGQSSGPTRSRVNRPCARARSNSTRSVIGAEMRRSSTTPPGAASINVFSNGPAGGSPFGAASAARSSIRTNSALTTSAPSRGLRGGDHLAPARETGQAPPDVATARSRKASVQPSASSRPTVNEAPTSSSPRRLPSCTTAGERTWIVPSASTNRPSCHVLHAWPETTPETSSAPGSRASMPRRARSTSRAATYTGPAHGGASASPARSIAKSIRPASGGSNTPEMRYLPPTRSRDSVTPSNGSGGRPRCSSIQTMRDPSSESFAWPGIQCASGPASRGPAGAGPPNSPTASVPSGRRTTANDAPLTAISRGCKALDRSRSSGSTENLISANRIERSTGGSAGVSAGVSATAAPSGSAGVSPAASMPVSRTSSMRNTGVQPRQTTSIAPTSTCRSAMRLSHASIWGR